MPLRGPARAILRIGSFRHDALEAHALDFVIEEHAFRSDVIDKTERTRFGQHIAEKILPFEQRQGAKVEVLEGEDVERLQRGRESHRGRGDVGGSTQLRPLLEP